MANDGHAGEGEYNVNVARINSYPVNGANPNTQNSNMVIQGWQGQYQNQGRGPYGYNQAWYPGAGGNMMYVQPVAYPSPPPATNMNMNMNGYNDGYNNHNYYYHPPTDGFYPLQAQPQFPVQPQPGSQPVFDAGTRGSSSSRHSGGRNSNTLQEAVRGRGRGRVFRDNNYNNNTSLPQVMGNIGEQSMRMRINESERSTQVQGQGRVEPDEHANAAVVSREYSNAKFFVIKSYSRENVVNSIKHAVWTSTRRGNRILNAAFRESRHKDSRNAIFLFFSVEGSGNFCGVAEMVGPVDFEASADCWDRDWKGKFPVTWHTIKDVPYSHIQHITFNAAENPNMSIVYSRDTQQVEFEKGMEMLDIFNNYVSTASLLDDVSKSTASPQQQQSQPPSPARQQQNGQPEGKEKEKEKGGENGCEQYCTGTGSVSCDINANQIKLQDTIEDSPNDMQLQEILNIFEKGMGMLDILFSTKSLLDDVSKSTASPKQQQSQPPSPARQQQQEQPEGKENEKEKGGKNGCELYCTGTGSASYDIYTNQIKLQDKIEDSPNDMQLQEILNIFEKGMDIFDKYSPIASLLDDVSKSTASAEHEQQSTPPSAARQEQPEEKEKEKEKGENGCELYCNGTVSAKCDINTNQIKLQDTIEGSPNDMQMQEILNTDESTHLTTLQEIVNTDHESCELIKIMVDTNCDTDEAQQTHLDTCMKPPAKTTVDKEETHQSHVETSYEPEKFAVDTDATTQVNEDNTGDSNQNMTS